MKEINVDVPYNEQQLISVVRAKYKLITGE